MGVVALASSVDQNLHRLGGQRHSVFGAGFSYGLQGSSKWQFRS